MSLSASFFLNTSKLILLQVLKLAKVCHARIIYIQTKTKFDVVKEKKA